MNGHAITMAIVAALACTVPAVAEDITCRKASRKGKAFEEHELTLTVSEGRIVGLAYENAYGSGEEGGTYACSFGATDGGKDSKWIRVGHRTRVEDKEPGDESFAEIEALPNGVYAVSLATLSRYHCGFGAEFPERIVVRRSSRTCLLE